MNIDLKHNGEVIHPKTKFEQIEGIEEGIKESTKMLFEGKSDIGHKHTSDGIYIDEEGTMLTNISTKHISFKDSMNLEEKISLIDEELSKNDSEFVIPRITEDAEVDEITISKTEEDAFSYDIKNMSPRIESNEDGIFIFKPEKGEYADLILEFNKGNGDLSISFEDSERYYSYSHRKIDGTKNDSGWIQGDKKETFNISEGDSLRFSTASNLTVAIEGIPKITRKTLFFNGEEVGKETDLSEINFNIAEMQGEIKNKAEINHTHDDLVNKSQFVGIEGMELKNEEDGGFILVLK